MADRYQDRPFPAANEFDRGGGSRASAKAEGDPLAELARLIGQTDPFGSMSRANLPLQPRAKQQPDQYDRNEAYELPEEPEIEEDPPPGPPSWIQRARQETPPQTEQDHPGTAYPLHHYAAEPAPEQYYDEEQQYVDPDQERDLSRYDEALYGGLDTGAHDNQHDQTYADDAYAYEDEYGDGEQEPKRRGRMAVVVAVLALAVFGVGGAYAYRSYMGSARSGEPPIIRADAGPTKIVPAPTDAGTKVPDRLLTGDGSEKLVPREEAPVDVNARSGPRVVFPPLNQSGAANLAPGGATPPATPGNGTLSNGEPRKIRTFAVRGDPTDPATAPAAPTPPAGAGVKPAATARTAAPAPAARTASAANPSAANANAPLSLSPQGQPAAPEPTTRVATTNPTQTAPAGGGAGGGYLVQVSSQRSEADAQASYKALQGKFPSVLGSYAPLIKRADLGDKGVYYRAMVGPFNSPDEASQFCGSLKSAGGQCVVQRN